MDGGRGVQAILTFHSVDDSGSVLSVDVEQFVSLLAAIRSSGHQIVPLSRLVEDPDGPDRVALTFDDGYAKVAVTVAPILRTEGIPATLFLTTGFIGSDNRWPSQPAGTPVLEMMTWAQLESLRAQGWEIGAHSASHPDLRSLADAELEAELVEPQLEIERRLGRRPEAFAYPYGAFDERVVSCAQRYYERAVTTRMECLDREPRQPHLLPRLDAFYLRSPRIHRAFGSSRFRRYLAFRALLRRARRHPGEVS